MRIAAFLLSALLALSGPGKYTNPVLNSDYSDPDVIRVGEDYWMTSSSFNCVPGLQILHSSNLVDWDIVGAALPEGSPYWSGALSCPDHGNAVWAPAIRYRESDGRFYIFWGDPDRGIFQVSTDNPRGKWTDPVCVIPGKGLIDSCPLFDEDGKVYLVHAWAGSRAGFKSVLNVCELNSDCTRAISGQVLVFDGNRNGNLTVEGPKFYKRDGWYWIFAPAGGVKTGWQLAMRSKSPYGPYEWKRVCEAADAADIAAGKAAATRAPHQGGWVEDIDGRSWFLHFEDRHAWGRVVHLQPMEWTPNGWCIIGKDVDGDGIGEPVDSWEMPAAPAECELSGEAAGTGFTGISIPLNWQWHADPQVDWAMANPSEGCLHLNCIPHCEGWKNLWNTPNMLLEKVVGPVTELSSKMEFKPSYEGDRAGLAVMGLDYGTIEMYWDGEKLFLQRRECMNADQGQEETVLESIPLETVTSESGLPYCTVWLRVNVHDKAAGKGQEVWPPVVECTFSYSLDGRKFKTFGPSFIAKEGQWIGAKAGFFATAEIKKNDGGYVEVY